MLKINKKRNNKIKKINFTSKSLKLKTLISLQTQLNFSKYFIINNLNYNNLESLKIDTLTKAKLINTSQSRVLNYPFSGVTKIIFYQNLTDLFDLINLILKNNLFFKIIGIKLNNKFYLVEKFLTYSNNSKDKFFFSKKNLFLTKILPSFNFTFFSQTSFFLLLNFFNLLQKVKK